MKGTDHPGPVAGIEVAKEVKESFNGWKENFSRRERERRLVENVMVNGAGFVVERGMAGGDGAGTLSS
jgi:hypothetical protein